MSRAALRRRDTSGCFLPLTAAETAEALEAKRARGREWMRKQRARMTEEEHQAELVRQTAERRHRGIGPRVLRDPVERFWEKVDKSGECWVWTAGLQTHGYGSFNPNGSTVTADAFAWELENGPVPEGMHLHHECENPPCVRPEHLRLLAASEHLAMHNRNREQQ